MSFMAALNTGFILNPQFSDQNLDGGISIGDDFAEAQGGVMRIAYNNSLSDGPAGGARSGVPFVSFPMQTVPGETYSVTYTATEISASSGVTQLLCNVYDAAIYNTKDLFSEDRDTSVTGSGTSSSGTVSFTFTAKSENTSLIFTFGGDFGDYEVSSITVYGRTPNNFGSSRNQLYDINLLSNDEFLSVNTQNWKLGPNASGSSIQTSTNRFRLVSDDGNATGCYAEQTIKTVPGETYYMRANAEHFTSGRESRVTIVQVSDTSVIDSILAPSAPGNYLLELEFTATEETTAIRMEWDALGAGNYVEFDDIWVSRKSPSDKEVVLGLNGDTALTDYSSLSLSPDFQNNITAGITNTFNGGDSLEFNGTNSRIKYDAVQNSINIGTGDFCIEFWTQCQNADTYGPAISFGGQSNFVIKRSRSSQNSYWYVFGVGHPSLTISTLNVPTTEWHHVAVERYNGDLYLYFDGRLENIELNYTTDLNAGSTDLTIGHADVSGEWYDGYLNEIRICDSAKYKGFGFVPSNRIYNSDIIRIQGERSGFPAQNAANISVNNPEKRSRNTLLWLEPNVTGATNEQHYCDMMTDGGGWVALNRAHNVNDSKLNTAGFGGANNTLHPKSTFDWKFADSRINEFKHGLETYSNNDEQNFRITIDEDQTGDVMYYRALSDFVATQRGGNQLRAKQVIDKAWSNVFTAWDANNDESGFLTRFISATTQATHLDGSQIVGTQALWSVGAESVDAMFRTSRGVLWTR